MPDTTQSENSAALAQTFTSLSALVAALVGGTIATPIAAILAVASNLLQANASGEVTQEQWDAAHTETADVLAQINARRS